MSPFHFARMFRLSTGFSPMAYVLRQRIERARLRLAEGHEKLSDLAAELGFCDQSHFTRLFRRTTGFTPREYARRLQHQFSPRFGVVAAGSFRNAVNDAEFARRSAVSLWSRSGGFSQVYQRERGHSAKARAAAERV